MNDALKLIRNNGCINIFAESPKSEVNLNWEKAPFNFKLNFCQMLLDPGDLVGGNLVVDAIKHGDIDCSEYISDVFDFKDYKAAFDLLLSKGNNKKIVLKFD